jgi:hypothetical protein
MKVGCALAMNEKSVIFQVKLSLRNPVPTVGKYKGKGKSGAPLICVGNRFGPSQSRHFCQKPLWIWYFNFGKTSAMG